MPKSVRCLKHYANKSLMSMIVLYIRLIFFSEFLISLRLQKATDNGKVTITGLT